MSSQSDELKKRLNRFVYETAARKGRRLGRTVMLQLRVTEPGDPIGPGVDMGHFKAPKANVPFSDIQNITGEEITSNSFSNERVSPQDTGNFISSIREEDNIDACLRTLSGQIEVDVGTNVEPGDYIMKPKGKSYGRRSLHEVKVPWSRTKKYKRNLDQYNNDTIPDNWYENWDKIVKSNINRIIG